MIPAWHYDGQTATRHEVGIAAEDGALRLSFADGRTERVPWADFVWHDRRDGASIFGRRSVDGWRIGIPLPMTDLLARRLPSQSRYGGLVDRFGIWPAVVGFSALSAAVILTVWKAPDILAPIIPMSWEQRLGDAMIGDLGGRICDGPEGQQALDALVRRIDPKGSPLRVRIVNVDMVNAAALPGGQIVVFRGLLQEARSPDELAGVLGHEIGHVRNRDVMQALLRQMGLSLLLGGVGGDVGGALNSLLAASYSRAAESRADTYAIAAMRTANVSPVATAQFFARMASDEKKLGKGAIAFSYMSSHPLSEDRRRLFMSSVQKGAAYTPAVTPTQWRAIVDACAKDPDVKEGDLF
ncbi:MAG: M48 family metallopeptidase [Chakrabartia godavariana]